MIKIALVFAIISSVFATLSLPETSPVTVENEMVFELPDYDFISEKFYRLKRIDLYTYNSYHITRKSDYNVIGFNATFGITDMRINLNSTYPDKTLAYGVQPEDHTYPSRVSIESLDIRDDLDKIKVQFDKDKEILTGFSFGYEDGSANHVGVIHWPFEFK